MVYVTGFVIWTFFGLLAAGVMRAVYPVPSTAPVLTYVFGFFGAFVGGMLGVFPYVAHNPYPTRVGALVGAALGGILFSFIYHLVDRKAT
jgi:uncharacterized membrane protein YeaQ/YmgE (transglycosylase-associated protein family)